MSARLRINVFSPLPPLPTDIANHTVAMLPFLAELAEVRVWTAQDEVGPLPPGLALRRFHPEDVEFRDLNWADANIYNIGNNASFHQAIFAVAARLPGLVILHDTRLQHFFARYSEYEGPDREFYLQAMRRFHGPEAEEQAREFIAGRTPLQRLVDRYPLTLAAADTATGLILHNRREYDELRSQTRLPVYFMPLSFRFGPPPVRRPRGNGPLRLVMFGFIGENRRMASVLQAIAGLPERAEYRLDVYGRPDDPDALSELVAEYGMADQVSCHGYVEEKVLDTALAEADLALNLRWPSMGEASGSQLRIWAACLPALVTRTGWYETLPSDTVFLVDPDREVEDIRTHLRALRADPAPYEAAGRRGRQVLERDHAPAAYAAELVRIAGQQSEQHGRRAAVDLVRTSMRELLGITDPAPAFQLAPAMASAIHDILMPTVDKADG